METAVKTKRKWRIPWKSFRFRILAVTIAAVTILMGILLFNNIYAINVVHNQVSESNYRVLNMYMSNVDNCFEAIENYFVGLQSSSSLITAAYTKDDKEFYISQARLIRELEASVSSYDYIEDLLMTSTHHFIMFFTNKGKAYRIKAYQIPESSRVARGTAIVNILQLEPGEKITAMIPIRDFDHDVYLFMATKKGIVKKTSIKEYDHIRKTGIISINLREDDELIEVKTTNNENDVFLITKHGKCIRFNENDVRPTGRTSMGVIGMTLEDSGI